MHSCTIQRNDGEPQSRESRESQDEDREDLGDLGVRLRNFRYRRGHVHVRFQDVILRSGKVYAITGANGCGKSTFFALLASCGRYSSALPPGMEESDKGREAGLRPLVDAGVMQGIMLRSDDIVEISQQMYCPLYIEPMTWLQRYANTSPSSQARIPELMSELDFVKESSSALRVRDVESTFSSVETNWYAKLSGGQRSKAELISQIFLRHKCPDIVLIDEALAPLDADSKILVQQKLKSFCSESVLLVIHHMDSHSQCVSSGGFFDDNLHFENGTASLIGTCPIETEQESRKTEELVRHGGFLSF